MTRYRYQKRTLWDTGEVIAILRNPVDNPIGLESWKMDHWEDAMDLWWQTIQEPDYDYITKKEAMVLLKDLTERQRRQHDESIREAEERRLKELEEQEAERIRHEQEIARRTELDDWTPLERSAFALHELFTTLMGSGFTEDQAIKLVSRAMYDSSR